MSLPPTPRDEPTLQPSNTDALIRALAGLVALEQPTVAERAAAQIPPWLDVIDVLRAADGATQLARALDRRRRTAA